jgi:hypothetical protein
VREASTQLAPQPFTRSGVRTELVEPEQGGSHDRR